VVHISVGWENELLSSYWVFTVKPESSVWFIIKWFDSGLCTCSWMHGDHYTCGIFCTCYTKCYVFLCFSQMWPDVPNKVVWQVSCQSPFTHSAFYCGLPLHRDFCIIEKHKTGMVTQGSISSWLLELFWVLQLPARIIEEKMNCLAAFL